MLLSQHDQVIQALASEGAHQPFGKRILPRAVCVRGALNRLQMLRRPRISSGRPGRKCVR